MCVAAFLLALVQMLAQARPDAAGSLPQGTAKKETAAAFVFADVEYFHRFTTGNQREYTPAGQEDLDAWTDMVTIFVYPDVKDGDALVAHANAVVDQNKASKAVIVKLDSVPKTKDKPAEYLLVASLAAPGVIELAFSRFRMYEGLGTSVIYAHRIYGKNMGTVGDQMSAWLAKNGPGTEKNLMTWDAMPKSPSSTSSDPKSAAFGVRRRSTCISDGRL
jgi:hypothetical protein